MWIYSLSERKYGKSLLKKKEYLVMKRRKSRIPIVSNLPELLDKLKIHLLTIMSCINLDVNISINRLFLVQFVSYHPQFK